MVPECKYCGGVMVRFTDDEYIYYKCTECGSRGPAVFGRTDDGKTIERLDRLMSGMPVAVEPKTPEDTCREALQALSSRYSRLKACELPNNAKLERDVNNRIRNLQGNRKSMGKVEYLKELAHLYKQKATFLEYRRRFEDELADVRAEMRGKQVELRILKEAK